MSQLVCPTCQRSYAAVDGPFCKDDGSRLVPLAAEAPVISKPIALPLASKGSRLGGYLMDVLISLPLVFFAGTGFGAIALIAYWLFRDVNGASLGKLVVGTKVVGRNGGPASTQQRIVRNIVLVLPMLVDFIPVIGVFFGQGAFGLVSLLECIFLLATGERISDKLADTAVVRKA